MEESAYKVTSLSNVAITKVDPSYYQNQNVDGDNKEENDNEPISKPTASDHDQYQAQPHPLSNKDHHKDLD